jgi:hypothetical protein
MSLSDCCITTFEDSAGLKAAEKMLIYWRVNSAFLAVFGLQYHLRQRIQQAVNQ